MHRPDNFGKRPIRHSMQENVPRRRGRKNIPNQEVFQSKTTRRVRRLGTSKLHVQTLTKQHGERGTVYAFGDVRYHKTAIAGRGTFGKAMRMTDHLGQKVVMKTTSKRSPASPEESRESIEREILSLTKFDRKRKQLNLCLTSVQGPPQASVMIGEKIGFVGEAYDADGSCFIEREKSRRLDPKIRLSMNKTNTQLYCLGELLHAIASLSRTGYHHIDIKPKNIFFYLHPADEEDVETLEVALGDFGEVIATEDIEKRTPSCDMRYTQSNDLIAYMTSEADKQTILDRISVFQVAASLFEIITHELPYTTVSRMNSQFADKLKHEDIIAYLEDFPEEMTQLILQCLDPDYRNRPSSEEAFVRFHAIIKEHYPEMNEDYQYRYRDYDSSLYESIFPD